MKTKCQSGAGLRPAHYFFYENEHETVINWFEALTENYMNTHGRPRTMLHKIRKDYPVALHGVSLNIASAEGLDFDYLKKLKNFALEIEPFAVSDHLCWTGHKQSNIHDLLPIPYTRLMLNYVCEQVDKVQSFLGRTILLENPSTYFSFKTSEMTEWEFFNELMNRTKCQMLLDINNVFVSASNNFFDPYAYLDKISLTGVKQIHLAGFTDMGTHLFDTHSKKVFDTVWNLFSHFIRKASEVPFMVEWDADIPEFSEFEDEIKKAIYIWNQYHGKAQAVQSQENELRV